MMENCIFYRPDNLAQLLFKVFSFSYYNYNSKIYTKNSKKKVNILYLEALVMF